jgi:hypothetical protein
VCGVGLHWNAIDLIAIAVVVCSPGLAAGLLLGALAWRERHIGPALHALAGTRP